MAGPRTRAGLVFWTALFVTTATALRTPASAVPQTPWEALKGRKLVSSWSGDARDAAASAAVGIATGLATRVVARVATGVAMHVAFAGACFAVAAWAGVVTIHWRKLEAVARDVVPDAAWIQPSRFASLVDRNGDGRVTGDDFVTLKSQMRNLAKVNEHASFGGLGGVLLGLTVFF